MLGSTLFCDYCSGMIYITGHKNIQSCRMCLLVSVMHVHGLRNFCHLIGAPSEYPKGQIHSLKWSMGGSRPQSPFVGGESGTLNYGAYVVDSIMSIFMCYPVRYILSSIVSQGVRNERPATKSHRNITDIFTVLSSKSPDCYVSR